MAANPVVAGLVLAGGRGERLGGCDKGFLSLAGEPFAQHLVRVLLSRVDRVAISANESLARYRALAEPVLVDERFPGQGPLAGLYEGLCWAEEQGCAGVIATTCDTPLLSRQWVARIATGALSAPDRARLTRLAQGDQPLHGYFPVACRERVERNLLAGERRAWKLADALAPVWVDCEDLAADFLNINRPEDLERL